VPFTFALRASSPAAAGKAHLHREEVDGDTQARAMIMAPITYSAQPTLDSRA